MSGNPAVAEVSALRVMEAVGIEGRNDMPGHLYFFRAPQFTAPIPPHQENARQKLENLTSVLRIAFQKADPERFAEFFNRALTMAQATFDPTGFNEAALNDSPNFKQEVVQVAGASIKAKYTRKLAFSVAIAIAVIVVVSWAGDSSISTAGKKGEENQALFQFSLWNTGLLLSASFLGLLFASMTRAIEPTFETLLTPNADLMEPWMRLLFYGIAIIGIALLFQTRMVTIAFGEKVSTAAIAENWLVAISIGLFLGFAERALPKEVQQWSSRFLPSAQPGGQ